MLKVYGMREPTEDEKRIREGLLNARHVVWVALNRNGDIKAICKTSKGAEKFIECFGGTIAQRELFD